jgi:hypothetical protein
VHPHLAQTLTTERIKGWQEEAAQARLAREARRARRGRRGWGAWRTRAPVTTGLASPSSGPTPPAPSVTARRGAAAGRPAGADERQLAAADEDQPMTADAGPPAAADERQPAGPRAA